MMIFLASSVTLRASSAALADRLEAAGHVVCLPCNPEGRTELEIFQDNANEIERCDVVFALWSGASDGTPMDVAMAIALGKPVYVTLIASAGLLQHRKQYPNDVLMRRAWALFGELPKIEEWWEEQAPAATHGGDSGK